MFGNHSIRKWLTHVGFWCFMVLFVFDYHWFEVSVIKAFGFAFIEVLSYMFIFYTNLFFISLKQFRKPLIKSLAVSVLLSITYITCIRLSGLEQLFYEADPNRNLFSMIMNTSLFIGLSYMVYYISKGIYQREANLKLTAENRLMQMEVLKSRINPHFIFNTLNNLYALIIQKDEKVPQIVSKLSNVLRYAADDGEQDKVSIQKEVKHLKSYIDLILLQEPSSEKIDIYTEGLSKNHVIIPFILVTLLENAVKHGNIKYDADGYIDIIIMEKDDDFEFSIQNSKSKENSINGTGLANIKKQLDLAYAEDYQLNINFDDDTYSVKLSIPSSKMIQNDL